MLQADLLRPPSLLLFLCDLSRGEPGQEAYLARQPALGPSWRQFAMWVLSRDLLQKLSHPDRQCCLPTSSGSPLVLWVPLHNDAALLLWDEFPCQEVESICHLHWKVFFLLRRRLILRTCEPWIQYLSMYKTPILWPLLVTISVRRLSVVSLMLLDKRSDSSCYCLAHIPRALCL